MSTPQSRLQVIVDVFEEQGQRASIVPHLTVGELIESILHEFRSLAYMSDTPAAYSLIRAGDRSPLNGSVPLGQQIKAGERLVLVEAQPHLPEGTQMPRKHAYLRDEATGKVYKLHWCPAIIGRRDSSLPQNERIAVDLAPHERGLRVSRRHAQIGEEQGRFFIESLSQNPTTIYDTQGQHTTLNGRSFPLDHGQLISLDQSQIVLKFIVRDEEAVV
jgi:hypothetical protein